MENLRFTLLGTLAATAGDSTPIRFRTDKIRALLAYLVVESERPHLRHLLAALFWPEMAEQAALKNLRQSLYRLQQALDEAVPGIGDALFSITRQAVQCTPAGLVVVDVLAFERLLAESERHDHRQLHLCRPCLDRLTEAAALYQGELLAGFSLPDSAPFDEWLLIRRERLQQQAGNVLGKLTAAHTTRGEYGPAQGYAARLVALDPFREESHRQLMRLLALTGQLSRAIAQYENLRRLLRLELGVDPAPETTALYQQIAAEQRGDAAPRADGPGAGWLAAARPAALHHFPMQFTPFVARDQELQQIEEMFLDPDCRLLTLVGPGGMGKTRLSQRAAERLAAAGGYPDGIYFISLAAVTTEEALLTALLDSLGVTPAQRKGPLKSLLDYLRDRQCLLVLDNFEQLADSAPLLNELLSAAAGLRLLATSLVPLQLRAERRLTLGGLDYPAADEHLSAAVAYSAVRLFVDSARHADPAFQVTGENIPAVLEICRLVQGAPLALELAAAWARVMDPPAIVREIRRNLDFLSLSPQDRPGRHQSMAAVFAYSWQLLAESDRVALAQLSVFSGPFSLEAALTITGATPLAVARLLDMSLLQRRRDGRYELHELLHQFVNRQPVDSRQELAQRHCDYYLDRVAAYERAFYGPQPRQAVAAVQAELSNVRHAWRWAVEHRYQPAIQRSLEAVGRFYQTAALLQEGEAVFALAAPAMSEAPRLQARLLVWQGYFLLKLGRQTEALRLARLALALSDGDALAQAEAHSLLGEALDRDRQLEPAKVHLEQALAAFTAQSDMERLARTLRRMVQANWRSGDQEEARRFLQRALPIHQSLGDKKGLAQLYNLMAGLHYERNEFTLALAFVEQSKQMYEDIGDRLDAAVVAANLSRIYSDLGRFEEALASNQQALEFSRELGDRSSLTRDLSNQARILFVLGKFELSLDSYFQALELALALDDRTRIAEFQAGMAAVYAAQGDRATALTYYDLALPALREQGIPYHLAGPLLDRAELQLERGQLVEARALCAEARELAAEAGLPEYVRRSRLLGAKVEFAAGEESAGLRQMIQLLAEAEAGQERAELQYELWRMTRERSRAEAAEIEYRRAFESRPSYSNRSRVQELQRFLAAEVEALSR